MSAHFWKGEITMLQKQNHTMESLALVTAEDSSATSLNRKMSTAWDGQRPGDSQNEQRGAWGHWNYCNSRWSWGGRATDMLLWYGIIGWAKEILVKDYFKKELNNNITGKVYLNLLLLVSMDTRVNFPLIQKCLWTHCWEWVSCTLEMTDIFPVINQPFVNIY